MNRSVQGEGGQVPLATSHFYDRIEEREIPDHVLDALDRNPLVLRGFSPMTGQRAKLRIVRVTEGYWVAPSRQRCFMSAYFVENARAERFFRARLENHQELSRVHRMPVTKSKYEHITEELTAHYADTGVLDA